MLPASEIGNLEESKHAFYETGYGQRINLNQYSESKV